MSLYDEGEKHDRMPGSSSIVHPAGIIRHLWEINPFLTTVALLHVVVLLAAMIGIIVDDREITGMPAWVKPAKFAISISIYSLTFVWLTGYIKRAPRLARMVGNVTAVGFVVEMALIALQAARGTTSHFNNATPFDQAIFGVMGLFIIVVWLMNLAVAIMLVWEHVEVPALAMGLRMGLWLTLIGSSIGILMILPTQDQLARMRAGEDVEFVGAHSVGAPDGGPGLPFVGWNKYAGDFRPAHFLGLHALQILPLFGWFMSRRKSLSKKKQRSLVFLFGAFYLTLVLVLLAQAARSQSVASPATLVVLGVLVALFAGAILFVGRSKK
jgi:hypothetical protein